MKSGKIPIYIKIPLIIVIIIIGFYIWATLRFICDIQASLRPYSRYFKSYIEENKAFPLSEADLMNKGYLIKEIQGDDIRYRWNPYPSVNKYDPNHPQDFFSWDLVWYENFIIYYGFNPQDVELKNGKLYDKITKQQVLLIKPSNKLPTGKYCKIFFEHISLEWYQLLVESKK